MTDGKISRKIILFALPIFLGNLFQQLYNVVDSLVVGNVLGKEALAAVSSTGSLIFLIVGFINGIFVGAGVIISRYFGAKKEKELSHNYSFWIYSWNHSYYHWYGIYPLVSKSNENS